MSPAEPDQPVPAINDGDVADPGPTDTSPKELAEATEPQGDAVMERTGDDQWVLLWSRSRGALRSEPLVDAMAAGFAMLKGELEAADYILLYLGSRSAVDEKCIELSPRVDARAEADEALGLRHKPIK